MLSYWEKKHFTSYDLIVVGAGIVGLSTAIQYKQQFPGRKVLVLERGIFPSGASTRNAGFACFGSLTEILDDLSSMEPQTVFELVERRVQGLNSIRKYFGEWQLGVKLNGGFELLDQRNLDALSDMEKVNDFLHSIFDASVFYLEKDHAGFGFGPDVKAVVKNRFEGTLDTGKFIQALWSACSLHDIRIMTGTEVIDIEKDLGEVLVRDVQGKDTISLHAKQIAICTNAFATKFFPGLDIKPGRGLILLTKPLVKTPKWEGAFHIDKGYVYFRDIDGRLLLGGGRNQDFEGEETTAWEVNPKIKSYLLKILHETILPNQEINIEMEWTGTMAFGNSKKPIVEMAGEKTALAVRMGGMGVAIGWNVGKDLVKLLAKV